MTMAMGLFDFGQSRRRRRRYGGAFLPTGDEFHTGDGVSNIGEIPRIQFARMLVGLLLLLLSNEMESASHFIHAIDCWTNLSAGRMMPRRRRLV